MEPLASFFENRNIEFPLSWPLSANIQKFKNVHNDANVGEKNANEDGSDDVIS